MYQTKGAIGNLINRYRAVLKKCHLLNTFGSLAVAAMLVMGGAGVAKAANPISVSGGSEEVTEENLTITGTDTAHAISVTGGELTIDSSTITLAHGTYGANNGEEDNKKISLFVQDGTVSISADTLTFVARNATPTDNPPTTAGTGDNAVSMAGNSTMTIDVGTLYIGSAEHGGDRGFRLVGADNTLTILADTIISYTGDEFVHVRNNAETSVANIGTADRPIGYFEAHTTWGKDDYGVAILQANEGGTINFYADTAVFDGSLNEAGGVFGSGSYGTVNVTTTNLTIYGNMCGTYGLITKDIDDKTFSLNVTSDSITMEGNINAGNMGSTENNSNTKRKTSVTINASDFNLTGDINGYERSDITTTHDAGRHPYA